MSWAEVWAGAPWAVVAALVLWFVRDRRKDRAAAEVAERTVGADVELKDVSAQEARLVYAVKAFDAERDSYVRRIDDLEVENGQLRAEVAEYRAEVNTLRGEVGDLQQQLALMGREVTGLQSRLSALAERPSSTSPNRSTDR